MTNQTAPLIAGELADELAELRADLETVWDAATSASPHRWHPGMVSIGQCAVTALVVADRFGGELLRTVNEGDSHYFNRLPDGTEVDLTRDQFHTWAPTETSTERDRSYLESSPDTMRRYQWLTARLDAAS